MDGETDSDGPRENQGQEKGIPMEVENLLVDSKNSGTKGNKEGE